jgi:ribosomal protein S18 acetylase RimI-like enzyme
MVEVRSMTPADAEAASALLHGSWLTTYGPIMGIERARQASAARHTPATLSAELADPKNAAFVAQVGGEIVGYALARLRDGGVVYIDRLHVLPSQFGRGVADRLMQASVDAFPGHMSITLDVLVGNDRAIAYYRRHGFEVAERRNACGGIEGSPSLVMRKAIAA